MRHFASPAFWEAYDKLPTHVRALADKTLVPSKQNPRRSSLQFKTVGRFCSTHVGLRYRALAVEADGDLVWFWIGSQADYDALVIAASSGL
jgi:hypothetical protein